MARAGMMGAMDLGGQADQILPDHAAPISVRRLDPKTEKTQASHETDCEGQANAEINHKRYGSVGQNLRYQDPPDAFSRARATST